MKFTWAADGHVHDLVIVSVSNSEATVVDQTQADAEDGDIDLLFDPFVLAGRVGQTVAEAGVLREELILKCEKILEFWIKEGLFLRIIYFEILMWLVIVTIDKELI